MSFAITRVEKFGESLNRGVHYFDTSFTGISDNDSSWLAEVFDELGFEPNPGLGRCIRVGHKNLETVEDVTNQLKAKDVPFTT